MIGGAVVVDVEDPPLSATERAAATVHPGLVLRGLGEAALQHPHATLHVRAAGEAEARLRAETQRLGAEIAFAAPPVGEMVRLRASELVERAWRQQGRGERLVTVAGAVHAARVYAASGTLTIEELVAHAQPTLIGWTALYGGELVGRDVQLDPLIAARPLASRLLLVLPVRHALVRRAKAPLRTWIRRAQSACAACAICEPRCAAGIPIAQVLRALSVGGAAKLSTSLVATAAACTSCAACDLACPSALSPSRVIGDLGHRLRSGGVLASRTPRPVVSLDRALSVARQGLRRYDREPPLELSLATRETGSPTSVAR